MIKPPKLKLQLIREKRANYQPAKISSPNDVEKFLGWMAKEPEEVVVVLHLNTRHEVIAWQEVSRGTVSASLVHPREVFKAAVINNSTAIIVAHNHPTGETTPNQEDKDVTKLLVKAGQLMGISVLDHIIIGDRSNSLRGSMPELWRAK